jgi:hypothetical protein
VGCVPGHGRVSGGPYVKWRGPASRRRHEARAHGVAAADDRAGPTAPCLHSTWVPVSWSWWRNTSTSRVRVSNSTECSAPFTIGVIVRCRVTPVMPPTAPAHGRRASRPHVADNGPRRARRLADRVRPDASAAASAGTAPTFTASSALRSHTGRSPTPNAVMRGSPSRSATNTPTIAVSPGRRATSTVVDGRRRAAPRK